MKVTNHLPLLLDCLRRWERRPSLQVFTAEYWSRVSPQVGVVFDEIPLGFWQVLAGLDWERYRGETLSLDAAREEARLRRCLGRVEELFGLQLTGEVILFGAFTCMDGYARFDRGQHRVFLGVDESHGRGAYLDVLETHELTHVVRETRPSVWEGWGLSPSMSHDEFVEHLPVVEHLANEGFACVVSELLNPAEDPWHYAYQEEDGLREVLLHGAAVDQAVHEELRLGADGDYGRLYGRRRYGRPLPAFAHYVWAWQWMKHVLRDLCAGDARALAARCSKELIEDALAWKLEGLHLDPPPHGRTR